MPCGIELINRPDGPTFISVNGVEVTVPTRLTTTGEVIYTLPPDDRLAAGAVATVECKRPVASPSKAAGGER